MVNMPAYLCHAIILILANFLLLFRCQQILLESMELGENIARNAALRENVFMMAVCIDLRIPLFLVGKPGSSKSLAKSIVANSMQGQASSSDLLKSFKQVSPLNGIIWGLDCYKLLQMIECTQETLLVQTLPERILVLQFEL